jgi:transcription factor HY5
MDSDDDIGRVPEFRLDTGGPSTSGREQPAAGGSSEPAQSSAAAQAISRRRGRSPADKEHRRLKRYCTLFNSILLYALVSRSMQTSAS